MQFALCLLACLLIVGDATRPNYGNFDFGADDNYNNQNYEAQSYEENLEETADYNFNRNDLYNEKKKRAKLRSQVDNDRGNRDMLDKFQFEMIQCHVEYRPIDLFSYFNVSMSNVEFHDSHMNQAMEKHCMRVSDTKLRVIDPCSYFPNHGVHNLCYERNRTGVCSTKMNDEIILMREIGSNIWFPRPIKIAAGCNCNLMWHY